MTKRPSAPRRSAWRGPPSGSSDPARSCARRRSDRGGGRRAGGRDRRSHGVGAVPHRSARGSIISGRRGQRRCQLCGQHLTLLNVPSTTDLSAAIRQIWWSANSDSVITYRKRVGLFDRPSVGVVVQALLNPTVAGVMFTQNPINGADERLIEASWGLG